MAGGGDISALYREFTDALTEDLAENSVGLARRGRLARARAALKKHPITTNMNIFSRSKLPSRAGKPFRM